MIGNSACTAQLFLSLALLLPFGAHFFSRFTQFTDDQGIEYTHFAMRSMVSVCHWQNSTRESVKDDEEDAELRKKVETFHTQKKKWKRGPSFKVNNKKKRQRQVFRMEGPVVKWQMFHFNESACELRLCLSTGTYRLKDVELLQEKIISICPWWPQSDPHRNAFLICLSFFLSCVWLIMFSHPTYILVLSLVHSLWFRVNIWVFVMWKSPYLILLVFALTHTHKRHTLTQTQTQTHTLPNTLDRKGEKVVSAHTHIRMQWNQIRIQTFSSSQERE